MGELIAEQTLSDRHVRDVLGTVPTSVSVITATDDGRPVGLVVGTFTSISLDPRLVGFFVDKKSTTWPYIEKAGSFVVNVLGGDGRELCAAFAVSGGDKFADVDWHLSARGLPRLDSCVSWIEADIKSVHELGDHFLVVGSIVNLERYADDSALVFWRGALCSAVGPVL